MRKPIRNRRKSENDRLMVGVIIPKEFFNHPHVQDRFMSGIEEDDNTSAAIIEATGSKCWRKPNYKLTDNQYLRQRISVPLNDLQGTEPDKRFYTMYMHRLSYSIFSGLEIPEPIKRDDGTLDDFCLDHVYGCKCLNPQHIELVPRSVNTSRKGYGIKMYKFYDLERSFNEFNNNAVNDTQRLEHGISNTESVGFQFSNNAISTIII